MRVVSASSLLFASVAAGALGAPLSRPENTNAVYDTPARRLPPVDILPIPDTPTLTDVPILSEYTSIPVSSEPITGFEPLNVHSTGSSKAIDIINGVPDVALPRFSSTPTLLTLSVSPSDLPTSTIPNPGISASPPISYNFDAVPDAILDSLEATAIPSILFNPTSTLLSPTPVADDFNSALGDILRSLEVTTAFVVPLPSTVAAPSGTPLVTAADTAFPPLILPSQSTSSDLPPLLQEFDPLRDIMGALSASAVPVVKSTPVVGLISSPTAAPDVPAVTAAPEPTNTAVFMSPISSAVSSDVPPTQRTTPTQPLGDDTAAH